MRCPICDYAPGMPESAYHSSLALPKNRSITEDPNTGEIICDCFGSRYQDSAGRSYATAADFADDTLTDLEDLDTLEDE